MPFFQTTDIEETRRIFAAGPSLAYYMEPPEAASKPFVNRIVWTSDGGTLLVRRLVPPAGAPPLALAEARQTLGLLGMMRLRPRVQLVAWSRAARTTRTLLDFDSARARIEEIEPMAASDRALVLVSETPVQADGTVSPPREAYILLSTATGASVRLWTAAEPGDATTHIQLSPTRAMGVVLRGLRKSPRRTVAIFGADGKVGPEWPLKPGQNFEFTADGGPGISFIGKDKKGRTTWELRRLDPRTGALGAEAAADGDDPAPSTAGRPSAPKEPAMSILQSKPPKGEPGIFLRIRGGEPSELGLVAVDGAFPLLSPRNDAVAYVFGNGAYVRALVKVDRKAYDASILEGERQKAILTAKKVGLAMAMYAGDADDEYPLNGQKDSVEPYLKDRAMLDKFVYTFGGGNPAGSGNPATTEIGYVAGPGGRAVVYADGSVKWMPDGF